MKVPPDSKFSIGDTFWHLSNGKAVESVVWGMCYTHLINASQGEWRFRNELANGSQPGFFLKEDEMFESKEALIASL